MAKKDSRLGVYALVLHEGDVVLIKKAKGPFTGLWDLPGGKIEFGESPREALEREVLEETGLTVAEAKLLDVASNHFRHVDAHGQEWDMHHIDVLYMVTVESLDGLKVEADGLDSLGSAAVPLPEAGELDLTPFARLAVEMVQPGG